MARILCLLAIISLLVPPLPMFGATGQAEEATPPFAGRWIDVDLTSLTATAYEDSTPVYTALVTTGMLGWETPTGTFRILRRILKETMDSATIGIPRETPEGYLVKDVPYTQYITNTGVALHGNYWTRADRFGAVNTSHGCVGLLPDDAIFFWDFAAVGTPVVIHYAIPVSVPGVVGKTTAEAKAELEDAGLSVELFEEFNPNVPAGLVILQMPAAGDEVAKGSTLKLLASKGPAQVSTAGPLPTASVPTPTPTPTATPTPVPHQPVRPPQGNTAWVPETVGLSEDEARRRIEAAGLVNTYVNFQAEADVVPEMRPFFHSVAPGHVLSSQPPAGTEVVRGGVVRMAVRKD